MDIDLNCDLGEGCGHDGLLLPLVTSASICGGFYAGGPDTAHGALVQAAELGVTVGAHPGFPDREHFGRRELWRSSRQIYEDCVYQIGGLVGLARAVGTTIKYVKPHGALYHLACRDDEFARPVVDAAVLFGLPVVGLPGAMMEKWCQGKVAFVPEGFADRRYQLDGSLVPRSEPDAFVHDPEEAVEQVEQLLTAGTVRTLCIHGDNPEALAFAAAVRQALLDRGHVLKPFA